MINFSFLPVAIIVLRLSQWCWNSTNCSSYYLKMLWLS